MPPKTEAAAKYSKHIEVDDDPNDFEDIIRKQEEISKNTHDWKQGGCSICRFPRSEHHRFVQKHRLCKTFLAFVLSNIIPPFVGLE